MGTSASTERQTRQAGWRSLTCLFVATIVIGIGIHGGIRAAGQEPSPAATPAGAEDPANDAASVSTMEERVDVETREFEQQTSPSGDLPAASGAASGGVRPDSWMKSVDEAFGDWVVTPLATVLFFDFYTGQWLGASIPFVVAWLLVGAVFFTLRMGFINIRGFWHALRLTRGDYDDASEPGEVTHFQALASALSATVGLGNIAGVAIAVGVGGPGATFWMIVCGLLGMTSKFTECTLGQMYRKVLPDGTVLGGPMEYLRAGLKDVGMAPLGAFLSVTFALLCIGASFGGGCAFQVGQSLGAIRQDLPWLDANPWSYGIAMAVLAGVVIVGGIRSIGAVASKIVPFMCVAYVLAAIYILITHAAQILPAMNQIVVEAFTPQAAYGGFLGVLVTGIRRAVFSNEAGVGSAAIAHSAAKTDEPVSEGIVALLEPFIDTVVVCTMTALVIVITGVYADPVNAEIIASNQGAALTKAAFIDGGHDWFKWILYAAVVLFAYSTLISWSYYGERCSVRLFGERASLVYKIVFLLFVILGSIVTESKMLEFSDLLILGMSLPNILGLYFLSNRVKHALDDYWARYKNGEIEPLRE